MQFDMRLHSIWPVQADTDSHKNDSAPLAAWAGLQGEAKGSASVSVGVGVNARNDRHEWRRRRRADKRKGVEGSLDPSLLANSQNRLFVEELPVSVFRRGEQFYGIVPLRCRTAYPRC